jgi:hypothetical protein
MNELALGLGASVAFTLVFCLVILAINKRLRRYVIRFEQIRDKFE